MKTLKRALAPIIAGVCLVGCVSTKHIDIMPPLKECAYTSCSLVGRYRVTELASYLLRLYEGIKQGTIKVKKTENGYTSKGSFSGFLDHREQEKMLKRMDIDNDFFISDREASRLQEEIYEEYSE
jgi:hypothetical protein